ncbi:hypothetical protein CROQUDRAFT_97844 [Cronartium quercuum f. sp. fusiforme G11]|uniref:Uncharacterized protein n=1 Tax=Cronartium quercuum f. sp. fusiforme G11 TaxID=708437 RepID=A0A9P6T7L3_9BASI|nr:hypothetical protein CROQUDRAFT_97844 [Cronartium quercuum f. sp. fusiforme G11]
MAGETADETPGVCLGQKIKFKLGFVGGLQQADNFKKGSVGKNLWTSCKTHWTKWKKKLVIEGHQMFFNDIQILENFKQAMFPISDELDVDENENGNSAILQVEDMAGNLNMQVQILGCQIYGKTKEVLVKSQQDWSEFLVKALVAKDGAVSVVYTVVNPAQKHAEEEATLTCKQATLQAHNILARKTITASAIVDTVPQDPKQPWLAQVMNRHGTCQP